jgi:glycosyltransferase involved in cell wall biosynthesis
VPRREPAVATAPVDRAGMEEPELAAALAGKRIVMDCRWLGLVAGVGRVTELLLERLREEPPPGEWVLWGRPERLQEFAFPGASFVPTASDPRSLAGQRETLRVPRGDVALYMHQIRPLRPGPSVTIVHDTIALRHGSGRLGRTAKRLLFLGSARFSSEVLTDSEFSKACVARDLGVPPARISVMRFPLDLERAAAIADLRERLPQEDRLLYVGRFVAHKNVERLARAFAGSEFAARGGALLLVGGWDEETAAMRAWLEAEGIRGVEARPACAQDELDRLLASSRALVVPSLEEGYGLPAFEAAAAGLPVAASRVGAMPDLPPERVVLFDPTDVEGMTAAIDEATSRRPLPPLAEQITGFRETVLSAVARAAAGGARS